MMSWVQILTMQNDSEGALRRRWPLVGRVQTRVIRLR